MIKLHTLPPHFLGTGVRHTYLLTFCKAPSPSQLPLMSVNGGIKTGFSFGITCLQKPILFTVLNID